MRRLLDPVRPEYEVVNDSLKGEDAVMVLMLESHSLPGVPNLPQNDEEDGVPDCRIQLRGETTVPKIVKGGRWVNANPLPYPLREWAVDEYVRACLTIEPATWT